MTPDSINMELENIVANTVLLKAREGKDGDGGVTAPLPPVLHRCTGGEGCPGWGGGTPEGGRGLSLHRPCTSARPVITSSDAALRYEQDVA